MNTFGENIKLTVFGQSHAACIGAVIDGLPAGTPIDMEYIDNIMKLRAPGQSRLATKRKEPDKVEFISGVVDRKTVGASVCAVIYNSDTHSSDYSNLLNKPRPSHADYPAMIRYGKNYDLRGGGQFSGRLTAPLCIAGAIALYLLEKKGIFIASHVLSVGKISDVPFSPTDDECELLKNLSQMSFAVIDSEVKEKMSEEILEASKRLDSVGGVIECKVIGLPAGVGEPMFGGMENAISKIIFGIPAVKGIEFGAGFEGSKMYGSQYNDSYYYDNDGKIRTYTNNTGGICGGMTTGMPLIFRAAVKPTPSIASVQKTVDLSKNENTEIQINGRHDPCIAVRACTVVRAAAAFAVLDMLCAQNDINNILK